MLPPANWPFLRAQHRAPPSKRAAVVRAGPAESAAERKSAKRRVESYRSVTLLDEVAMQQARTRPAALDQQAAGTRSLPRTASRMSDHIGENRRSIVEHSTLDIQ